MLKNEAHNSESNLYPRAALDFAVQQPSENVFQHGTHACFNGMTPSSKGFAAGVGLSAAAGVPLNIYNYLSTTDTELSESGPLAASVMALTSVAMIAHGYSIQRNKLRQNMTSSRNVLQSHFDQPIDADKSGIRWFGFDKRYHEPGYEPTDATEEFARLVDTVLASNSQNVDITVSAAILDNIPDSGSFVDQETTGSIYDGRIVDKRSDPQLIKMSLDTAVNLKDALLESYKGHTISKSLQLLNEIEPNHPAYSIFKQDGFSSLTALENALRLRIETRASGARATKVKFDTSAPSTVVKGHSQATVQGRKIMYFSETPPEKLSGKGTRTFEGSETIAGAASYAELFQNVETKISNGSKPAKELEQIAWRALQDYKEQRSCTPQNSKPIHKSVGARIQSEKPRAFPLLRRYAKGYDADTSTLEFRSPNRKKAAYAAGGMLVVASLLTGVTKLFPGGTELKYASQASNLNTDGSTTFGDAGSLKDGNSTLWKMDTPKDVDVSGYWPQVNIDNIKLNLVQSKMDEPSAPYKDVLIEASADQYFVHALKEVEQTYPSEQAVTLTRDIYMPTDSRTFEEDTKQTQDFISIPVLKDAFVTSAKITIGDRASEYVEKNSAPNPETHIYTMPDGSYYLGLTNSPPVHELVHVTYTVEKRTNELRQFKADAYTEYDNGFLDLEMDLVHNVIDDLSAIQMAESLPGDYVPEVTDLTAVAEAVRTGHSYSLTPYEDAGIAPENGRPVSVDVQAGQNILKNIGISAASLDSAICNTAVLQTFLMTRGLDEEGLPIQMTTGFASNGDKYLTSAEGHMWLTDTAGQIIESTPPGFLEVSMTLDQKWDIAKQAGKISAATLAASGLLYFSGRKANRKYTHTRLKTIAAAMEPENPNDSAKLTNSVAFYEWLLYAPDRQYTSEQIRRVVNRPATRDTSDRLVSLPAVPGRDLKTLMQKRELSGTALPPELVADTKTLVSNLRFQRKHTT